MPWEYHESDTTPKIDAAAELVAEHLRSQPMGAPAWRIARALGIAKSTVWHALTDPRARHGGRFARIDESGRSHIWANLDQADECRKTLLEHRKSTGDTTGHPDSMRRLTIAHVREIAREEIEAVLRDAGIMAARPTPGVVVAQTKEKPLLAEDEIAWLLDELADGHTVAWETIEYGLGKEFPESARQTVAAMLDASLVKNENLHPALRLKTA